MSQAQTSTAANSKAANATADKVEAVTLGAIFTNDQVSAHIDPLHLISILARQNIVYPASSQRAIAARYNTVEDIKEFLYSFFINNGVNPTEDEGVIKLINSVWESAFVATNRHPEALIQSGLFSEERITELWNSGAFATGGYSQPQQGYGYNQNQGGYAPQQNHGFGAAPQTSPWAKKTAGPTVQGATSARRPWERQQQAGWAPQGQQQQAWGAPQGGGYGQPQGYGYQQPQQAYGYQQPQAYGYNQPQGPRIPNFAGLAAGC